MSDCSCKTGILLQLHLTTCVHHAATTCKRSGAQRRTLPEIFQQPLQDIPSRRTAVSAHHAQRCLQLGACQGRGCVKVLLVRRHGGREGGLLSQYWHKGRQGSKTNHMPEPTSGKGMWR